MCTFYIYGDIYTCTFRLAMWSYRRRNRGGGVGKTLASINILTIKQLLCCFMLVWRKQALQKKNLPNSAHCFFVKWLPDKTLVRNTKDYNDISIVFSLQLYGTQVKYAPLSEFFVQSRRNHQMLPKIWKSVRTHGVREVHAVLEVHALRVAITKY